MMRVEIGRLLPKFIMRDRNGYAIAKALEAGLNDYIAVCEQGIDTITNPSRMPEWRLDEMAWEYSIPYDYMADVEIKRRWIDNAYDLSRMYGTAAGVEQYLQGYFNDASLEEASAYSGNPFHFRINLSGDYTAARAAWVISAVEAVKNVRSLMDSVFYNMTPVETTLSMFAGMGVYNIYDHQFPAQEQPDIDAEEWIVDESSVYLVNEFGVGMTL